jgi:hypothetical protein
MENKKPFEIIPGSALHMEAQSLSLSVAAIRKAQGKKNPEDVPVDSPEWHQVCQEFANDVLIVLGCDPEDMPEEFTAFELGYESEEGLSAGTGRRAAQTGMSRPKRQRWPCERARLIRGALMIRTLQSSSDSTLLPFTRSSTAMNLTTPSVTRLATFP